MCGITALEVEERDVLLATGTGFVVFILRWATKAVDVRLRLLRRSHLKTGFFCGQ